MQTALLIFIVVFALAIGFFLALFLLSLEAPFLKKLFQKEESESELTNPGEEITPATPVENQPGIQKPTPTSKLALRVWKDEGKAPVYEINGRYLEKEALPREILNFITIHEEVPAPTEPQFPAAAPENIPEPVLDPEEEDESEIKMLSVVDEVNDILQHKLHGSAMAGKGIHLMENHNKEIRFWVGLESYNDVSEIPDPEIRSLIDAAVKEWEQNRS